MTIVLDASFLGAALIDESDQGNWALDLLESNVAVAPHLLLVETASLLRRAVRVGDVAPELGERMHAELVSLPVDLVPYSIDAERAWELHPNVTAYDAWYVALAERLGAPLATLDERLVRATGPRCEFLTPPA